MATILPNETLVTLENIERISKRYHPTERECSDEVIELFEQYCGDNFLDEDDYRDDSWDSFINYVSKFGTPFVKDGKNSWVPRELRPTRQGGI